MPKRRCLDCGKVCYGWSTGPCPYCRSSNLEYYPWQPEEEPQAPEIQTEFLSDQTTKRPNDASGRVEFTRVNSQATRETN